MVFQKPNPFPMSIYDNIAYGPRTHGIRNKAHLDDIVEKSLRDAAIWDEVKDRLKKSALGIIKLIKGGIYSRFFLFNTQKYKHLTISFGVAGVAHIVYLGNGCFI